MPTDSEPPIPPFPTSRLQREAKTVELMLELYCRDHHQHDSGLCVECSSLWQSVLQRLVHCPFRPNKPTCVNCTVHCYKPAMRERIREVMRYSGPRMALSHPVLSVLHLVDGRREPPTRAAGAHRKT